MNTMLSIDPDRRYHPPHPLATDARPTRRVGMLDRAALHLGLALITWSRRRPSPMSRERHRLTLEQERAGRDRGLAADRMLRLGGPLR
jgi:hypothetical protein